MPERRSAGPRTPTRSSGRSPGASRGHTIESALLAGNPLGDPAERPLEVYLPPGYDDDPQRRYPSVYVIQGYTGTCRCGTTARRSDRPFPEAADALFAAGDAPPCVLVYVDAWTAYGGSQFVDSPGTGRYHSYLCDEVVPVRGRALPHAAGGRAPRHHGQVERRLRRDDHADAAPRPVRGPGQPRRRRAVRALLRPGLRQGRARVARYDGSYERFWEDFASRPADEQGDRPRPRHDLRRGRALLGRRRRHGPPAVRPRGPDAWTTRSGPDGSRGTRCGWSPRYADALRGLRAIYLDGGTRDEWFLELGALAFRDCARRDRRHRRAGIELFDATHGGIDYRYPRGIAYLAERLSP